MSHYPKIKMLVNRVGLMLRAVPPELSPELLQKLSLKDQPEAYEWFSDEDWAVRQYKILLIAAITSTFHRQVYEQLESNPKYINEVINYSTVEVEAMQEDRFAPMSSVLPSMVGTERLPVNPSDSNVFRLHELLKNLEVMTEEEILPYLMLKR
ncbi:MAG: hypothetical protein GY820_14415 [Gammaproteobacteria bacterium]|nr:hypothetical protein [Gammaproteobacteria bacterium]